MIRSLNTAATGMVAQQQNLDVIAHNLANVNTTGFKQQRAEFQDLMYQTFRASGAITAGEVRAPQALQVGLGSKFVASATSFLEAPLQPTNNPLDLAIRGMGFLQISRPDGTVAYTRDGSLKVNSEGVLTYNGDPLEPRVTIPTGARDVTIAPNGTVEGKVGSSQTPENFGQIQVVMFANPAGLTRLGQNLYAAGGGSGDPQPTTPGENGSGEIQSGFLEGSNVQIVEEMVRMILAQRAYEINSKAIQTADDMLGVLNNLKR
ncbi:MAG: flagellar basal-body rod protein FlgG [Fimbriimonadaceae bacterium]|nr:flagellar basal-body rod protein FlgG [Fimbriimonadaceae bacterium]